MNYNKSFIGLNFSWKNFFLKKTQFQKFLVEICKISFEKNSDFLEM